MLAWPGAVGRLAMVSSREETLYDLLVEKMTLASVWRINSRRLRAVDAVAVIQVRDGVTREKAAQADRN